MTMKEDRWHRVFSNEDCDLIAKFNFFFEIIYIYMLILITYKYDNLFVYFKLKNQFEIIYIGQLFVFF